MQSVAEKHEHKQSFSGLNAMFQQSKSIWNQFQTKVQNISTDNHCQTYVQGLSKPLAYTIFFTPMYNASAKRQQTHSFTVLCTLFQQNCQQTRSFQSQVQCLCKMQASKYIFLFNYRHIALYTPSKCNQTQYLLNHMYAFSAKYNQIQVWEG